MLRLAVLFTITVRIRKNAENMKIKGAGMEAGSTINLHTLHKSVNFCTVLAAKLMVEVYGRWLPKNSSKNCTT